MCHAPIKLILKKDKGRTADYFIWLGQIKKGFALLKKVYWQSTHIGDIYRKTMSRRCIERIQNIETPAEEYIPAVQTTSWTTQIIAAGPFE